MTKTQILVALPLCLALGSILASCSGGVAPTAPVSISADQLKSGQAFLAKQYLDSIEKMPANARQIAANAPKTAEVLYPASQSDPAIKKRMDDLGISVKPPAPSRRIRS